MQVPSVEKTTIALTHDVDLEDTLWSISQQIDHETIIGAIKLLDMWTEDWGVTEQLYEHFAQLHEVYLNEVAEDDEG